MLEPLPPLAEWESFYVILGSSAAALTGLMFVVIALQTEARRRAGPAELDAFGTPTVVHFGAVLLVAALLTTPRHTIASLRACLAVSGVAGVLYVGSVVRRVRRQKGYRPVRSDWVWHTGLPLVAYVGLLAAGVALGPSPYAALYMVGATALGLLYVGIHNAWDAAVWMTTSDAAGGGAPRSEPPSPSRSRRSR
ncbi:MAG TPA: hypothetical protein VGQ78_08315 [Vicinamibacteria bacterium]|nr:hypothetical protein [Vicinamibacteria bacterium]